MRVIIDTRPESVTTHFVSGIHCLRRRVKIADTKKLIEVQEQSFCLLYCQVHHSCLISYLYHGKKHTGLVVPMDHLFTSYFLNSSMSPLSRIARFSRSKYS
ncbi:uncharacterized protein LOC143653850 isoform X2 [Tamandua tetradactyla]|uniref:uncharacterized protein LOC143653850 isoform X2 n=1 Tax=Tamandua tetradactyla TaxID=48850 RepID=UPI004053CC17